MGIMRFVYLFECEGGKYYLSITSSCVTGTCDYVFTSSQWLEIHRPLRLIGVCAYDADYLRHCTVYAMKKYGLDNVRGNGSWSRPELPAASIKVLKAEMKTVEKWFFPTNPLISVSVPLERIRDEMEVILSAVEQSAEVLRRRQQRFAKFKTADGMAPGAPVSARSYVETTL